MKVFEMTAIQVRIYAEDTIPYHLLLRPNSIQMIAERFGFQHQDVPFPILAPGAPKVLNFLTGELKVDDRQFIIEQLNFENRKISLRVKGSTDGVNLVFEAILTTLKDICPGYDFEESKVILRTDQTECVVQLEIDFLSFFSQKFRKYYKSTLPLHLPNKPEMIIPKKLSLEISFFQPKEFRGYNVSLSPKLFTIEPRTNTRLEDKVFLTQSPCSSETHLKILKEIEELF